MLDLLSAIGEELGNQGEPQSRAVATLTREEPVEVIWTTNEDAPRPVPGRAVSVLSHWTETSGQTQDQLEKLHVSMVW